MTGRGLPDTEAQLVNKTIVRKLASILGFGAMLVPIGYASEARADTNQICTFHSDATGINYSEGVTHDGLQFSWNNTTGTLLNVTWQHNGATFTSYSDPGTIQGGYDPSASGTSLNSYKFNLVTPAYPGTVYMIYGNIANRLGGGDTTFSGIQFGTSTAWMGGYGNVSCVNQ